MAKRTKAAVSTAANEESKPVQKGLDIKLKIDKSEKGRLTITVSLLENGKEIASDYDFVQV